MIRILTLFWAVASLLAAEPPVAKAPPPYESFLIEAKDAERKLLLGKALEALDKARELDPKRPESYYFAGQILVKQRKGEDAIAAFTKVIDIDPKASTAYQKRGEELFKLGKIDECLADFNRYIQLEPQQEPYHWQRGIAFYYAKKYAEGRRQFELHQTVNPNDVENGVWHFLCVAKADSFEKARAALLPISGDRRVPMMEVYRLFAGKATVEDVAKAVKQGEPSEAEVENREFYYHFYVGLYYEAKGDQALAYEHIKKAATGYSAEHYMGDVARVHFRQLVSAK